MLLMQSSGVGHCINMLSPLVIAHIALPMRVTMRGEGRYGTAAEVASVVAFLANDEASYITGETIYPDGGRRVLNYVMPDGG